MPETHDLGPIFVHSIWLKDGAPMAHLAPTNELEEPYRKSKSVILRFPFTNRGAVFGWWRKTDRTEEEALVDAINIEHPVSLGKAGQLTSRGPVEPLPQIAKHIADYDVEVKLHDTAE